MITRYCFPSFLIWVIIIQSLFFSSASSFSCQHHHHHQHSNRKFEQKTSVFWEFEQESKSWVEVKLPYDLLSCVNANNCTKVGIIEPTIEMDDGHRKKKMKKDGSRNRICLVKMSEDSIWVSGVSGSIYERFWNGVQWVIGPRELPVQAGQAVAIFLVNHTVLALSEAGILYQIEVGENSEPMWVEVAGSANIKSGVTSHDRERIYFCTNNGLLLELTRPHPHPPRWVNHGKPPGADVAAIADAASIRPQVIFTISSTGDLYEFDTTSKPLWKKHIWSKESAQDTAFAPSIGCTLHHTTSDSLFLLTKGGKLVERRLHQRKWKWVIHGSPKDQHLTAITLAATDQTHTLFLTTASGSLFQYNISKQQVKAGKAQVKHDEQLWVNHTHPPHSKLDTGIPGLQFQVGRLIFPLNDGRLGELHQSQIGGDDLGPTPPVTVNKRRRASTKYTWSIIDAPESEGWNAEYCTDDRGPSNCIAGIKDEVNHQQTTRSASRRRAGSKAQEHYYLPSPISSSASKSQEETYMDPKNSVDTIFRLRVMHEGRSFFLITKGGLIYEYLNVENVWFWLQHEHPTAMKGALGNYNGSLFLADENKDLIIGERAGNQLTWINSTAGKKGRQVIGGPPWDRPPGKFRKVTPQDSLFFISKTGGLLQLTVALRKFKWKDCRNPSYSKIAGIVDQEVFRENIVFVMGRDGQLYQYNKVTGLWHRHYQSQHLILSRQPGTAMRPSSQSSTGSLFMISEDGRLIEYHWNLMDGWNWVEHGTPYLGVKLVGSPGPCVGGDHLFLIGSNGNVYLRYLDQVTWKWSDCRFPNMSNIVGQEKEVCIDQELLHQEKRKETNNCDPKVASTRPISFMESSVIFELRDGRLAEMKRTEDLQWVWWRTIGTPTSRCHLLYWTAAAS